MINVLKYNGEPIINVLITGTYFKRLLGYMFRVKPHYDALLLTPCNSINTFFMEFNIDVLFLDEHMQVIKKIENLAPGQIIAKVLGAKMVIESKEGAFNNIKEGNILDVC